MPYVRVHVSLDEIDDDDLIEHLENQGWQCVKEGSPAVQDIDDFIEGVTMIAERADLERVRIQFYQGNLQPAAELLINMFRDARGAAL